jgi:hypothetical protein
VSFQSGLNLLLLRSKEVDCLVTVSFILSGADTTTVAMPLLLVKRHRCKLSAFFLSKGTHSNQSTSFVHPESFGNVIESFPVP